MDSIQEAALLPSGPERARALLPVLDADGEIISRGGVTPVGGLYAIGLMFMRRRRSSFIDGCARDAAASTRRCVQLNRSAPSA